MACQIVFESGCAELCQGLVFGGYASKAWAGRDVDVLVLCAKDHQPDDKDFPGAVVLRCPFVDEHALGDATWRQIDATVKEALRHHREGKRVAVSCAGGYNRSALVAGRMLRHILGISARDAYDRIQALRGKMALSNPVFRDALDRPLR